MSDQTKENLEVLTKVRQQVIDGLDLVEQSDEEGILIATLKAFDEAKQEYDYEKTKDR